MERQKGILEIKPQIIAKIREILVARVATARKAMDEAQASANEEGKSSAGDKYETGRAMAQNIRDMNARQLQEAQTALEGFDKISSKPQTSKIEAGSLIQTNEGWFFLGAGLGKIETEEIRNLVALSVSAPLGQAFLGKKPGQEVSFLGKSTPILAIY